MTRKIHQVDKSKLYNNGVLHAHKNKNYLKKRKTVINQMYLNKIQRY